MSFLRSILLHLDDTPAAEARLAFARSVASQHDAALSAMCVVAAPERPLQLAFSESPAALLYPAARARNGEARQRFDRAVAQGGPAMRWLDPAEPDAAHAFGRQAMYADLLVLGQHDTDAPPGSAPEGFLESAILGSGKPAVVLPCRGRIDTVIRSVMVGWNATPAAARALTGALPWICRAQHVHVLQDLEAERPEGAGGLDIAQYLQLHGVAATLHKHRTRAADAGDALLSFAADVDADLLVMGCYGRGQGRERILGGASRTVLQTMTLPVLMAH